MESRSKSIVKFIALVLLIVLAVYFARFSSYSEYFSFDSIKSLVNSFGYAGFVIFVLIYALAAAFAVPGTVLTFVGAVLFGTWLGTILNLIGATLGGMIAFYFAQFLGRDFVSGLMQGKLSDFEERVASNGFSVILLLRLVPLFPYIGINYAAGLTKIKFKDYSLATFLGMIPGAFIYTYLFATLGEKVLRGEFSVADLLTTQVLIPIALFALLIIVSSWAKKKIGAK